MIKSWSVLKIQAGINQQCHRDRSMWWNRYQNPNQLSIATNQRIDKTIYNHGYRLLLLFFRPHDDAKSNFLQKTSLDRRDSSTYVPDHFHLLNFQIESWTRSATSAASHRSSRWKRRITIIIAVRSAIISIYGIRRRRYVCTPTSYNNLCSFGNSLVHYLIAFCSWTYSGVWIRVHLLIVGGGWRHVPFSCIVYLLSSTLFLDCCSRVLLKKIYFLRAIFLFLERIV